MAIVRRALASTAALAAAATFAACSGPEGEQVVKAAPPDHYLHAQDYENAITNAGATCDWRMDPEEEYTVATCGRNLSLIVADKQDVLDNWSKTLEEQLGHGIMARGDDFLAVTSKIELSRYVDQALGSESVAF
ncbi:hypothetical protein I8D64_11070 [Brachybacterium sp. MASK1Z-5]|uniref:DUF3558 domain-containing protein n=1 Tax=Brachybacterium halotolerans TaxID=2795215 RepID=A0ABS1BBG3_9MICO|nr:hypothetical protein [Brachybacterium halotolerans]MBK0331943.1 hypothetical protein [Brachybacterium halotolerans]